MAHDENLWAEYLAAEERRKAHLNGAANSNAPLVNPPIHPPVWGGWGQSKPRVRLPPALGKLGFPFVPPKPPPPTENELRAVEFRRHIVGENFNGGTGGIIPRSPR